MVPGENLYNTLRLRFHAPELAQAYKLLYPQDEFKVSHQVLDITGIPGLTALWLDCGKYIGNSCHVTSSRWDTDDWIELGSYLKAIGQETSVLLNNNTTNDPHEWGGIRGLKLVATDGPHPNLIYEMFPYVHHSMVRKLHRPSSKRLCHPQSRRKFQFELDGLNEQQALAAKKAEADAEAAQGIL